MRHENEMIGHGREAGFGKVVWKDFGEIPVLISLGWKVLSVVGVKSVIEIRDSRRRQR